LRFTFPRAICAACPLCTRCVKSKTTGRTVNTHPYEAELQAARQRQQTAEFKTLYPLRSAIVRKQAELIRHGLRDTRYLGQPKRQFQRLWTAAAVNFKRLFKLAETRQVDLSVAFNQIHAHHCALMLRSASGKDQPTAA
jgi:hypothetical protein